MLALYYSPIEDKPAPKILIAEPTEMAEQPITKATPSAAIEAARPGVAEATLQTATNETQSEATKATPSAIDKKPKIVLYWYGIP